MYSNILSFFPLQLDVLILGLAHTSVGMMFLLFGEKPSTTMPSSSTKTQSTSQGSTVSSSLPAEPPSDRITIINTFLPSFDKYLMDVTIVGLFHTIGNVFTLYSLSLLSVPLVLTVKGTEPIFAMFLLKCLNLEEANLNILKCISVLVMVMGTIVATVKEVEFEITAFLAAVTANFGFQLRNIYAKHVSKTSIKCAYNYGLISIYSFILIIIAISGRLFWTCMMPWILQTHNCSLLEKIISNNSSMNTRKLLISVTLSGICHSSYNFFSLGVLFFVSPVTHSVLNSLKRLLIIWISIMYFNSHVSIVGLLGSLLVITGKSSEYECAP